MGSGKWRGRVLVLVLVSTWSLAAPGTECDWRKLAGGVVRYITRQVTPSENGVPVEWHRDSQPSRRLLVKFPAGKDLNEVTIPSLFLHQARSSPDRVLLIDGAKGPVTNRDIVAGVYFLKPRIAALGPEQNIGILLPASVGATVTTLATQFAGKTPTMLNFTVGNKNLRSAMETAGVKKILCEICAIKT